MPPESGYPSCLHTGGAAPSNQDPFRLGSRGDGHLALLSQLRVNHAGKIERGHKAVDASLITGGAPPYILELPSGCLVGKLRIGKQPPADSY